MDNLKKQAIAFKGYLRESVFIMEDMFNDIAEHNFSDKVIEYTNQYPNFTTIDTGDKIMISCSVLYGCMDKETKEITFRLDANIQFDARLLNIDEILEVIFYTPIINFLCLGKFEPKSGHNVYKYIKYSPYKRIEFSEEEKDIINKALEVLKHKKKQVKHNYIDSLYYGLEKLTKVKIMYRDKYILDDGSIWSLGNNLGFYE